MNNNVKRKNHYIIITLVVFVICLIIGTIIAGIQFMQKKSATSASTTLELSFETVGKGIAPNGNRYDVKEMASDQVLQTALEASSLSDMYTPDQIRSCLVIRGVYPEDIQEQYTSYVSVLPGSTNQEVKLTDYYPSVFSIVLTNDFDASISQANLTMLLDQIVTAYKNYFSKAGAYTLEKGASVFELSDYDYLHQLKLISLKLNNLKAYVGQLYEKYPNFRWNGQGFNDILNRLENVITEDLSRTNAQTTINAISKDIDRLLTVYTYEYTNLNIRYLNKIENLKKADELVSSYEKNVKIYLSTADSIKEVTGNSTVTYDKLVEYQRKIANEMTNINTQIGDYKLKIQDISGKESSTESLITGADTENADALSENYQMEEMESSNNKDDAQTRISAEIIEEDIHAILEKHDAIVSDLDALIQAKNAEQINDVTVSSGKVKYYAPRLLSGSFFKQVVKTAGPFCAIALMICLMVIFISKRKECKQNED